MAVAVQVAVVHQSLAWEAVVEHHQTASAEAEAVMLRRHYEERVKRELILWRREV